VIYNLTPISERRIEAGGELLFADKRSFEKAGLETIETVDTE
jgi:hypothetical protein